MKLGRLKFFQAAFKMGNYFLFEMGSQLLLVENAVAEAASEHRYALPKLSIHIAKV